MRRKATSLQLEVLRQPDDSTCGPTCLHAVYRYWRESISLDQVIGEIDPLPEGGTLAVTLACHALRRGYRAEIYTSNLQLFDPTWFVSEVDLTERLTAQAASKTDPKLKLATEAYLELLNLGGSVLFEELTPALLTRFLERDIPILTGLSATYLYSCAREIDGRYDDILGEPVGHFVVLSGYDHDQGDVIVADPLHDNPGYGSTHYKVRVDRLIAAILLGIVTYDANLLILTPPTRDA